MNNQRRVAVWSGATLLKEASQPVIARGFFDMRQVVHAALTSIMGWFAYLMLMPKNEMVGDAWAQFLALATQRQWGWLFLTAAAIGLAGLLTRRVWLNMACTFLLGSAHACLAVCFYMAPIPDPTREVPTAVGTYAIIAMLGFVLTLRRMAVVFGFADEKILVLRARR